MKSQLSKYFDYKQDKHGNGYLEVHLKGIDLLRIAATNKGTAFTDRERRDLGLDGLLPPHIVDMKHQLERLYRSFKQQPDDMAKYQFLRSLQERSEFAYYGLLEQHLEEMMPIIYTPTVGKAVQQYSSLYQSPRGITLSSDNIDRADNVMSNYPWGDVRMIVATDSSAILGIGDQGHGGLAICIGKLALYTAGCGVSPFHTMPVNLDVGTDRHDLLQDPSYLGIHQARLRGDEYFALVDKFVDAVQKRWPKAVIQWEDFAKNVAFEVLQRYKDKIPCFNDDIQGTGAVVLAGLLAACHKKDERLKDQRVAVVGAGAGGVGVARAIIEGMIKEGLSEHEARQRMFVFDARGLVVEGVTTDDYKLQVSQYQDTYQNWTIAGDVPQLMEVIEQGKPTVLLGLSGISGLFSQPIVETMAENSTQPIIFPLSNPTSNCEALPDDIIKWTNGKAIVASGSPFADVVYEDQTHVIGQGNNAFIFPGLGFATIVGKCTRISDDMIIESAYALAEYTIEKYAEHGLIFPPVADLQEASIRVAARVLQQAIKDGSSRNEAIDIDNIEDFIRTRMWWPDYLPFVYGKGDDE
jgi:malate dehydrogenase (oxaloacetate-decarboxylating)